MADCDTLTPKQRAFARALLTERDVRSAALAAGIGERTAFRWLKLEALQREIADVESAALAEATRGLLRLAADAVNTLGDAMSTDAATGARILAADIVLARLLQLRELVQIEARVTALETALRQEVKR